MEDNPTLEDLGLDEIVAGFGVEVENIFVAIEDDDDLDDDERAELIKTFEEIEELVTTARKIVGVSTENDG